jgi:hypothetical protein
MDGNLLPGTPMNRTGIDDAGLEINLSRELRGSLAEWTFLLGSADDARWLGSQGLNAVEWTRRDLSAAIRGCKLILVTPDLEDSQRFARDLGAKITERGLATFRVWVLNGLGSRSASLQDWCEHNDFPAALAQDRPWEPAEKPRGGAGGGSSATPRAQPPRFTSDPRPISIELLPVPRLEDRLIPAPLRAWVVDIGERGAFPLEFAATAAIVALSGLIGRRIALKPKRADEWLVVPNLWGAVVGPPGIQKTPPVEEALRPLLRLASDSWRSQLEATASFEKGRMVIEARQEAARLALRKAARQGKPDDELARLAADAQFNVDPLSAPTKRYLVHDVTVEKLGELLAENTNGLTLFRDELIGFLRSMDRQGHESDRGFYLEAWNGSNSYAYDRIGRGTIMIPNSCLAIFGTIQPGPLARYLRASASGEEADGFMPRFQVLVYPDPVPEFSNVDRKPDAQARSLAYAVFQAIDQVNPVARGCSVDLERGIPFLRFDPVAQDFFDEWRIKLEMRLRSGQESSLMAYHLAKYRSLMPSLALIFHLIDSHSQSVLEPVTLRAARDAAAWCELLEAHARRIYQSAMDGDLDAAVHLGERIKGRLSNPFNARDVARKGWSGLTTAEEVRLAAGILQDRGWIKAVEVPTDRVKGGRPTELFWIHPTLINRRAADIK